MSVVLFDIFYVSPSGSRSDKNPDILSGILSELFSDIPIDIYYEILFDIHSDIFSDSSSDIYSDNLNPAVYLTNILTIHLTYFLTVYLTYIFVRSGREFWSGACCSGRCSGPQRSLACSWGPTEEARKEGMKEGRKEERKDEGVELTQNLTTLTWQVRETWIYVRKHGACIAWSDFRIATCIFYRWHALLEKVAWKALICFSFQNDFISHCFHFFEWNQCIHWSLWRKRTPELIIVFSALMNLHAFAHVHHLASSTFPNKHHMSRAPLPGAVHHRSFRRQRCGGLAHHRCAGCLGGELYREWHQEMDHGWNVPWTRSGASCGYHVWTKKLGDYI